MSTPFPPPASFPTPLNTAPIALPSPAPVTAPVFSKPPASLSPLVAFAKGPPNALPTALIPFLINPIGLPVTGSSSGLSPAGLPTCPPAPNSGFEASGVNIP